MAWDPLYTTALASITQDTWFWRRLLPTTSNPITATASYTVPDPAPGAGAVFRLMEFARYGSYAAQSRSMPDPVPHSVPELASGMGSGESPAEPAGYASIAVEPSHRTIVALNQAVILDQTWAGKWARELTSTVPAGGLVSGLNDLRVGAWVTTGNVIDYVYANYWELDYRRLFRAWQGQFDFRPEAAGTHEYVVKNWTSKYVTVLDITDPAQPRRLTGVLPALDGAGLQLRFRTNDGSDARYWLQEEAAYQSPASLRIRPDTGLRSPAAGADAVIVTPAEFRPAAERLAAWHEAHGRRRSSPTCRMCMTSSTRASGSRRRPSRTC